MWKPWNIFSKPANKALVLVYHRVANVTVDPWQLAVTPDTFEQQIIFLKKHYSVISFTELLHRLKSNLPLTNSVCITFDDGYTDNLLQAQPILLKHQCHHTLFVASNPVGSQKMYWWDALAAMILEDHLLPGEISLLHNDFSFHYKLTKTNVDAAEFAQQKLWHWPQPPATERCQLYFLLWEKLMAYKPETIDVILQQLQLQIGFEKQPEKLTLPMSIEQLQTFAASSLCELGVHTANHPALPALSLQEQQLEIMQCNNFLQEHFSNVIPVLAYPYGRNNADSQVAAANAGLQAAVTTASEAITHQSPVFTLGRMQVNNWSVIELQKRMRRLLK